MWLVVIYTLFAKLPSSWSIRFRLSWARKQENWAYQAGELVIGRGRRRPPLQNSNPCCLQPVPNWLFHKNFMSLMVHHRVCTLIKRNCNTERRLLQHHGKHCTYISDCQQRWIHLRHSISSFLRGAGGGSWGIGGRCYRWSGLGRRCAVVGRRGGDWDSLNTWVLGIDIMRLLYTKLKWWKESLSVRNSVQKGDDERASQGSKAASFGIYCMQTRTITHKTWQTKKIKQNTQGKGLIWWWSREGGKRKRGELTRGNLKSLPWTDW